MLTPFWKGARSMDRPFFIAQETGEDAIIMEVMTVFLLLRIAAALLPGRSLRFLKRVPAVCRNRSIRMEEIV